MLVSMHRLFLAVFALSVAAHAEPDYGHNASAGKTLQIGDAKIYYEVYGHGPKVVLLHGGGFGCIDEFSGIIPALSKSRTVIAVGLRGHGKSELGKRPLTYQLLADDVVAIVKQLGPEPVDLVGFSSGAITALVVTTQHPELVRSLVAVAGVLGAYGLTDDSLEATRGDLDAKEADVEKNLPPPVLARKRLNPDPGAFGRVARELHRANSVPLIVSKDEVRSIQVPTLVAAGDRDGFGRLEHLVDTFRLLNKGHIAVIPGCGHVVFRCNPDLMLLLVQQFLAENGGPVAPK